MFALGVAEAERLLPGRAHHLLAPLHRADQLAGRPGLRVAVRLAGGVLWTRPDRSGHIFVMGRLLLGQAAEESAGHGRGAGEDPEGQDGRAAGRTQGHSVQGEQRDHVEVMCELQYTFHDCVLFSDLRKILYFLLI